MKMWIQYVRQHPWLGRVLAAMHAVVTRWCVQADLLDDPSDVFSYLHRAHIGEDIALFYLAWALVAERQHRSSLADRIYGKGIDRYAEFCLPLTLALPPC